MSGPKQNYIYYLPTLFPIALARLATVMYFHISITVCFLLVLEEKCMAVGDF